MHEINKLDADKSTLRVLLYLNEKKEANLTTIMKGIPAGQKALYTALSTLAELQLIEEKTSKEFPFTRNFILTKKGQETAKHLAEIEKILKT